jgi:hypothetical protein
MRYLDEYVLASGIALTAAWVLIALYATRLHESSVWIGFCYVLAVVTALTTIVGLVA